MIEIIAAKILGRKIEGIARKKAGTVNDLGARMMIAVKKRKSIMKDLEAMTRKRNIRRVNDQVTN